MGRSRRQSSHGSDVKMRKNSNVSSGSAAWQTRKASADSRHSGIDKKQEQKPSMDAKFVISKQLPTLANRRASPLICQDSKSAFIACGPSILMFSLQTGLLIRSLRSKQVKTSESSNKTASRDVHRTNIIMLALKPVEGSNTPILMSICSQGKLVEWDISADANSKNSVLNEMQLPCGLKKSQTKLRHALFNPETQRLIVNEQANREFFVIDLPTMKVVQKIPQVAGIPLMVTAMASVRDKLVYIMGKNIVTQSLVHASETKLISRQAKLTTIDLSPDGKVLAVADEFGKIFVLYNFMDNSGGARLLIQSLPHWHAHGVSSLKFISPTLLVSGGKESVLVQWNLDRNDKTFISRLGMGEITSFSMSVNQEFYGCLFSNNQFKVCRFDNNKAVIDTCLLDFGSSNSI